MEYMMRVLFSDDRRGACSKKRVKWMRSVIVNGAEVVGGFVGGNRKYDIACKPPTNCALFVYGGGREGGYMILSNFLQMQEAKGLVQGIEKNDHP